MGEMRRRDFLFSTTGAAAAFATESATRINNKLIPYVIPPEQIKPGTWAFYATTCRECPAGCGMHVWHRDGRVTKAEGNRDHPVNRGGLCARGQSSMQGLYDPDRLREVKHRKRGGAAEASTWKAAFEAILGKLRSGGRVTVISDLQTGALAEVMKSFALDRVIFYEAFSYDALRSAHMNVSGLPAIPHYHLDWCDFIVSFAVDFLETWISPVQYAYEFSQMHSYRDGNVGRFAYVGPRLSMTAANADYFIKVPPGGELAVAKAMLQAMGREGAARGEAVSLPAGVTPAQIEGLAKRFVEAKASVALGGTSGATGKAATETAAIAALINAAGGRVGTTVDFSRTHALGGAATADEMRAFLSQITGDDVLFIHSTNPAFTLPQSSEALKRAGLIVYLGVMEDESAALADWVLPIDYAFETWGDYEPYSGFQGMIQPTMARLYDTRSAGDIFLTLASAAGRQLPRKATGFKTWLIDRWREIHARSAVSMPFDAFWEDTLRTGGVWEQAEEVRITAKTASIDLSAPAVEASAKDDTADLWVWPSLTLYDGRFANRGWMQEVPDPTTYIVWDTWIDMHPNKAKALKINDSEVIQLATASATITAPVHVTEDVDENTVAIPTGQGHTALGPNAAGRGANAFVLIASAGDGQTFGRVKITKTGRMEPTVSPSATQEQWKRDLMQWASLPVVSKLKWGQGDKLIMPLPEGYDPQRDTYPKRQYLYHRWAMVVDMQRCIGCGACAAACHAENNVAIVGKEQVLKGRLMSWLRVVPYREEGNPRRLGWIPLMCQHCDAAPCEPVCPVYASVHNEEGLNAQIFNRCIGTRYCSHNCPYKVRRFNWFDWEFKRPLDWQLNPEVTVRQRGVMEKCTFCVQRIRQVEYTARREDRPIRDGEIQPACVQSCPAKVFTFGDLLDPNSQVTQLTRNEPRRYHVLEELNTKPAVTYLRRVKADDEV